MEDIMAYNNILNHIQREENSADGIKWKYREILSHQHTYVGHPDRFNNKYNLIISWKTGAVSTESVDKLSKDFAVNLALYTKQNKIFEGPY